MKFEWTVFVCCLSVHSIADDGTFGSFQASSSLSQISSVNIDAISIRSDGVTIKRSAGGAVVPGLQAPPASCMSSDAEIHLQKSNNPYFREQFSALLTSHKVKQPVNLIVFDKAGVCFIEAITVTH